MSALLCQQQEDVYLCDMATGVRQHCPLEEGMRSTEKQLCSSTSMPCSPQYVLVSAVTPASILTSAWHHRTGFADHCSSTCPECGAEAQQGGAKQFISASLCQIHRSLLTAHYVLPLTPMLSPQIPAWSICLSPGAFMGSSVYFMPKRGTGQTAQQLFTSRFEMQLKDAREEQVTPGLPMLSWCGHSGVDFSRSVMALFVLCGAAMPLTLGLFPVIRRLSL